MKARKQHATFELTLASRVEPEEGTVNQWVRWMTLPPYLPPVVFLSPTEVRCSVHTGLLEGRGGLDRTCVLFTRDSLGPRSSLRFVLLIILSEPLWAERGEEAKPSGGWTMGNDRKNKVDHGPDVRGMNVTDVSEWTNKLDREDAIKPRFCLPFPSLPFVTFHSFTVQFTIS